MQHEELSFGKVWESVGKCTGKNSFSIDLTLQAHHFFGKERFFP
ncbi:hypothetical protein SACS_0230 [Parasaccharibacter apium]|uniref:Uncharacterized protein n=1 Tax=Parasaccharibacter apium TaxID=1510841 RepID=A0A7U7G4G3_9PROT|nr:hypothetical protein SACS_0230 [Parasaccharibacter apium]